MVIHELLFGGVWAEPEFTWDRLQNMPKQRNRDCAQEKNGIRVVCSNQLTVNTPGSVTVRTFGRTETIWGLEVNGLVKTLRNGEKQGEPCDYSGEEAELSVFVSR